MQHLYKRPPAVDTAGRGPMDLLSEDDYRVLLNHQKIFKAGKQSEIEAKRDNWTEDSLRHVAYLREKLLAYGFTVSFINKQDELVFGVILKSDVQIELDNNAKLYQQRGEEIRKADKHPFSNMRMEDAA